MKIQIRTNPPSYDHDNVYFMKGDLKIGFGYQSRDSKKICILRCPSCGSENYSINVTTGTCYSCGYNPNEDESLEEV